jgi:3-oxoacyl-[acyl-carrier protein] reductase
MHEPNSMIDGPLTGKFALVTGASRGIGRAIALRLASDGAAIIVNYAQDEASAAEVVNLIKANGGAAFSVQADVSNATEVADLFDSAIAIFGRLDVVVNSAGVAASPPTRMQQTSDGDFERVIGVNTRGAFNVMRASANHIADGGRIVALSTSLTRMSVPGMAAYTGSKAAVEAMVRVLAAELGGAGTTVNAVAPGMTETDMMRAVVPADMIAQAGRMTTLGRVGQPDDIASVVSFLCGPDGGWLTGQTLFASGTA